MRRVAVVLLALAPLSTPVARADPPPLEALAPRWDAGRVEAGTEVRHTYELRNRGPRPLQISVKPGCGCTTAAYDKEIPPGGTGKVTAVLDTTHVRGRVEKIVDVLTNDAMQPVVTLTILAESVRALVVEPGDQPTLRGPLGKLPPLTLTVRAPEGAPFAITAVDAEPNVRATYAPDDGDEDEADPKAKHRRWRVTLTAAADLPVGIHHATVTLRTTAPRAARFALPSTLVVTGPLVAMPRELRVGARHPTASVRVSSVDAAAFRVLRVDPSDPDLAAESRAVPDQNAWDVTVRYVGKPTRHGPLNAVVTIVTDAPEQRMLVIRVSGGL
ncbi:MAG: DUF1573 domain-containing protein [Deltaproteobacteria bacterium]|nr:DUF1573 domain-containing protein [Deltaproteobacteria bacterium]